MSTTITDKVMRSTDTPHTAMVRPDGWWRVTWLPGRVLTRSQAISAMTIAEAVGRGGTGGHGLMSGDPLWAHIEGWAAELDMTAAGAVVAASEPPHDGG